MRKVIALLFAMVLIAVAGVACAQEAKAEGYTNFCTLNAQFSWLESCDVRTEPYTSSAKTGKKITEGDVVFIKRLVKNEYGNLWAELNSGGYLCFLDKASGKECASFVRFNNGAAPVTTSNVKAPDGEIAQGTSFTFSGVLNSADVCPIFLFDIWIAQDSTQVFDEIIESWPSGVTTKIDITDYNINELYDISKLAPGEYTYMIRVWMGFTYEGHQICFGDKYVPIQKNFTITEKPVSYKVPSGSLSTKLAYLKNVFPEGWYWNEWTADQLGDETMRSITINGYKTTISTKPCAKHTSVQTSCNSFNRGSQCCGWARMLFTLVWGVTPYDNGYMLRYLPETDDAYLLDYIKPGDIVWTGSHYMFVTAVNGDTLTVSDCNADYKCRIQWARTITKSKIHSTMKSNGKGSIWSPSAFSISSNNWESWKVVSIDGLQIRCQPFAGSTKIVGTIAEGEIFSIDRTHVNTTSDGTWAWCKTSAGKSGWVRIDDSSQCVPYEAEECKHTNTEWVTVEPCTCTEPGVESLVCSDCGEVIRTDPLLPNGHTDGDWVVTTEATCTEDGEKSLTCSVCGDALETEAIPAAGHTDGDWAVTTKATCTEDGEKSLTCSVCGDVVETETIPASGHTDGDWVVTTEATCTEDGEKSLTCSVCGDALETEAIPAAGHTDGDWAVTTKATCTEDGEKSLTCSVCGDVVETETIPASGHTDGDWVVTTEATCTEDGEKSLTCSVCGDALETETIPAAGHTDGDWVVTTEATCTGDGEKSLTCSVCGDVVETETIPASGHTADEWVIITQPTASADGLKRQSCTVCGETLAEEAIPAKPVDPTPSVSYKKIKVMPGEKFTVQVVLTEVDGGEAARVSIDTGNAPVSFIEAKSSSENGNTVSAPINLSGRFSIMNANGVAAGKVGTLQLRLADNAEIGSTYYITLIGSLAATSVSGSVQIEVGSPRVPGDANEDGVADIFDALLVLKFDSGWDVVLNESNADVNADGVADIFDALLLLKYDSGWDVELK